MKGVRERFLTEMLKLMAMRLLMESITLENETQSKFNKDYALRYPF